MVQIMMIMHVLGRMLSLLVLLVGIRNVVQGSVDERFVEELLIKPLPSGHVYALFSFTTALLNPSDNLNFYRLFPMTIGEILQSNFVDEFHLSLTQGKWNHEHWGYPIKDRPAGAALWAWFKNGAEQNWKTFASALGGVTCSSLNFIDDTLTVVPKYVFRPEGRIEDFNETNLRLAFLPGEAVCTENLTPWLKLLPCSKDGLAQLLKARAIFSSHFISLGLDVKRTCIDSSCAQNQLLLQQYVAVVLDPTHGPGRQTWTIKQLFEKPVKTVCPLASKSLLIVDITENGVSAPATLDPNPDRVSVIGNKSFAIYDVKKHLSGNSFVNVGAKYSKDHVYWPISPPPVTLHRYVQGYGLDQGGIVAIIENNRQEPFNVTYFDVIPWYLRVYVHTLTITSNGKRVFPSRIVFQPSLDREKPCHLEVGLSLEPRSRTKIFLSFERAFLGWTEYPPDPHLGFYIGAASLTLPLLKNGNLLLANMTGDSSSSDTLELALLQSGRKNFQKGYLIIFSEILLITLPTPDFSMPYNVICFVCTVLALAFGPIHNITTKNLVLQDKTQKKPGFLRRLFQKLKGVSTKKTKKD